MPGQHIWHVKLRKVGQDDYEIAEIRTDHRRAPVQGEFMKVISNRQSVRAKIVSFESVASGSKTKHTILAAEQDDGNPPGHREATEEDFER